MGLRLKPLATLISFIRADIKILMSIYLLKSKEIEGIDQNKLQVYFPSNSHFTRTKIRRFFGYTKSGYLNSSIQMEIMKKFCELWYLESPGLYCYVFGDQFGAHLDPKIIRECYSKFVFLWSLPANMSHALQPLDNICFANMKNKFKSKIEEVYLIQVLTGKNKRSELFGAMYEAELEAFGMDAIKASFNNTGLYPLDPNKIKKIVAKENGKFQINEDVTFNNLTYRITSFVSRLSDGTRTERVNNINNDVPFLHSPEARLELADKKELEQSRKQVEKENKRLMRDQKKDEKIRRRIRNSCIIEGCTRVKQKSNSWLICCKCNGFICPQDKKKK